MSLLEDRILVKDWTAHKIREAIENGAKTRAEIKLKEVELKLSMLPVRCRK